MSDAAIVAIVTAIGGVIAGFFKLIDNQNKLYRSFSEKLSKSIDKMAESSEKVAQATDSQAEATNKQAKEAEKRNGHLGEQNVQIIRLVKSSHQNIIDQLKNVNEQHVNTQVVDTQQVKTEIVENKK